MKLSRLRLPEPTNLVLQLVGPNDPTLPPPRGRRRKARKVDDSELAHLEATRAGGGLCPEIYGIQHYWCDSCHTIFQSRAEAIDCCKSGASKVSICKKCFRRLSECTCPPLFGLTRRNALLARIYRVQHLPGQALS